MVILERFYYTRLGLVLIVHDDFTRLGLSQKDFTRLGLVHEDFTRLGLVHEDFTRLGLS